MLNIISFILILIGIILLIIGNIKIKRNKINKNIYKDNYNNLCILIPARDESKVIEGLLISIKNQSINVNMNDVYVIVEDKLDKTVNICKKYNVNVLFRTTNRQRKGYALDEAIKQIDKYYDLYFIFDADNILDKDYIKYMLETYKEGYDIGIGYRNCKNGNDNVIAACSSLTFSMINTLGNKFRNKYNSNNIISGTGFYIRGEWISKWNGFPFNTLTEDYELSLYATLNNMSTYYNELAVFYDEQPTKYKDTINQRIRWIKGYLTSRKKYIPLIRKQLIKNNLNYGSKYNACLGVKAYILIVLGISIYIFNNILFQIIGIFSKNISSLIILYILLGFILLIYLILMFVTIFILSKEKLDLNNKIKLKTIFYNPLYLSSYVYCFIKALFIKDVKWIKIEHNKNINI